ncbi:MerR family DNA-binding protein [Pseudomonas aeruginosa]|nr:MerR family DNA-binding protein [Pseudomonas aeruginosa]EIU4991401.1 MerR family DNA-binding protein [Pseudomonas aeruginosa]EIY2608117.1 MerR family DNA-binding protein [Pseudomonas aeruginosa]EIY2740538.1 MerR family DNA-binding protein [Pseudomonas aeruginosa]EKM0199688.1 MerR family DNA-binding protein [Pseudomonas aeruginosa]EKM0219895.1 MerR family DNA-binding protein [Pseudomonas aeruginosa]
MIRYYERIELVPASRRTRSGYRDYLERDVQVLRFIHHARELGFSLTQVRALLALWRDRQRPSSEVQVIAHHYIDALNARIVLLQALRDSLSYLAEHCDDLEQPPGPILDDLPPH